MRKNIEKIIGLTLCVGMLAGCAQTPETSLVKPKGNNALDAYKEADNQSVNLVKSDADENNTDTAEGKTTRNDTGNSKSSSTPTTTIRDLINAPQNYKSQVTDDSAKLVVNTDATVELPDVEKISAISVTPAEITQDFLDRVTDAFFQDAKIYTSESVYTQTKSEIKQTLDKLKEALANGNLDPYNYGTDENGDYIYNIYDDIEYWEGQYDAAPETKTLVEARPTVGNQILDGNIESIGDNNFSGIAQFDDGSKYYYRTTSYGAYTLDLKISRTVKKGG